MENILYIGIGIVTGYQCHLLTHKIVLSLYSGEPIKTKGFEPNTITEWIIVSTFYFAVGLIPLTIMACLNEIGVEKRLFGYTLISLATFWAMWFVKSFLIALKFHVDLYIAKVVQLRENYLLEAKAKKIVRQNEARKIIEAEKTRSAQAVIAANLIPSRGILEDIK